MKIFTENTKIYFDLSFLAFTNSGISVYSWELFCSLIKIAPPLTIIPMMCPFKTLNQQGLKRIINPLLRDILWYNFIFGIEAEKEDFFIFPSGYVPKKFHGRKYAVIIHDLAAWHQPSIVNWRSRFAIANLPKTVKNANCIFAISEYTAQDISSEFKVPREKIFLAPNGLSNTFLLSKQVKSTEQALINNTIIPRLFFLHVGNFEPKKNLLFLLDVYENFRSKSKSNFPPKLIFTGGESWKSSQFIEKINKSKWKKDIYILGRVSTIDLLYLYQHAITLVFPSTFEGFGMPVIEALSQGTPALIHANSSLSQFSQFGAIVLDDFNISNWSSTLQDLFERNKKIDSFYINKIKHEFSWERTAFSVYHSLLSA